MSSNYLEFPLRQSQFKLNDSLQALFLRAGKSFFNGSPVSAKTRRNA